MKKIFSEDKFGKKRAIGYIEDDTFHKVVNINKHLHRKSDSWAIDYDILKEQLVGKVKYINVTEMVYRKEYWTTPDIWFNEGSKMNFGHNLQCFLPLRKFKPSKKMVEVQHALKLFEDE